MSAPTMGELATEYLALRRRLGFALVKEGRLLLDFARHCDGIGHEGPITTALAVEWAKRNKEADPRWWATRLDAVRRLARYRHAFDPRTEVPPVGILGYPYRRKQPHIYSTDEIAQLLSATSKLWPAHGLRPHTYTTLFGLLAATGLRVSEALRLTTPHVDLAAGVLSIVETKFHKSRLVPVHSSTTEALAAYAEVRSRRFPRPSTEAFFLSKAGTSIKYRRVRKTFAALRRGLGWTSPGRPRPRIHDLRHTFVCRRVLRWYEEQADVDLMLPALSTYLGHARITDTYWYLTAVPDLMATASARFERRRGDPGR
jgi:integrase